MTSPLKLYPAESLLEAFCNCITDTIYPLSAKAVAKGSELFGAAILRKSDLSVIIAGTNLPQREEGGCPIWHGEIWTIKQFFELPREQRPGAKDCLFLAIHEPCNLCLGAIAWAGFDNFIHVWTYEETDTMFSIAEDLDTFTELHHSKHGEFAQQASKDGMKEQVRPEYKRRNKYFCALSFAELVAAVKDPAGRDRWEAKVEEVKRSYGSLSKKYREHFDI